MTFNFTYPTKVTDLTSNLWSLAYKPKVNSVTDLT